MNTTYRNRWMQYVGYDTVVGANVYNIKRATNPTNCIDLITGINLKTKIGGNFFLSTTAGIGIIYMSGFNRAEVGKISFIKPNYLLSLGVGYRFKQKK